MSYGIHWSCSNLQLFFPSQVWFTHTVSGSTAYYNVMKGMTSFSSTAYPELSIRTPAYTTAFCPGLDLCDIPFTWRWSDSAVWAAVDHLTGSCMQLEAAGIQWIVPMLWMLSTALSCASTALLAFGLVRTPPPGIKAFCGGTTLMASGGCAVVVFYILFMTDIFNEGLK